MDFNILLETRVTIDWNTIFIEFAVLFAIILPLLVMYSIFLKKVYKQFSLMNYDYILKHKKLILFPSSPKKSKGVGLSYILVAVSSYETGNSSDFEYYIDKVKCKKLDNSVTYWKAYYHFFNGNETEFLNCLDNLKQMESSDLNKTYIEILTLLVKKQKNEPITENELLVLNKTFSKKIKDYILGN